MEDKIIKSIFVVIFLLVLVIFSAAIIYRCALKKRKCVLTKKNILCCICLCLCTVLCLAVFSNYAYPFERFIEMTLIAEIDIPYNNALEAPRFWRAAYAADGLHSSSKHFAIDEKSSHLGFEWPDMDYENYTYIITFGQKAVSLSYNIWETIDNPTLTGAYAGHMILEEEFNPNKVYIYQICKMRIDNDFCSH